MEDPAPKPPLTSPSAEAPQTAPRQQLTVAMHAGNNYAAMRPPPPTPPHGTGAGGSRLRERSRGGPSGRDIPSVITPTTRAARKTPLSTNNGCGEKT
eukprot:12569386-Alexandrium_andersonii.AAC.1